MRGGRICGERLHVRSRQDSLPEWSKGVDSSSTSESCVAQIPQLSSYTANGAAQGAMGLGFFGCFGFFVFETDRQTDRQTWRNIWN